MPYKFSHEVLKMPSRSDIFVKMLRIKKVKVLRGAQVWYL